jgi:FkbM family methyltransferase
MLQRKLNAVVQLARTQGIGGIVKRIVWYIERYRTSDHAWIGRIVELLGNRVSLDGCQFDLSSPVIATAQKAGFLLNTYEAESRYMLQQIPADEELPIIELGASVGVIACVSHRRFPNTPQHIAVEANPALIPVLTRNRHLNHARFDIIPAALAYGQDEMIFHVHRKFVSSSIYAVKGDTTAVSVPTVTLQALVEKLYSPNPIILICDIEGAEHDLFQHEFDLIQRTVKYLAIEFHPSLTGQEAVNTILIQLAEAGFVTLFQQKDDYLFHNQRL